MKNYFSSALVILGFITIIVGIWMISRAVGVIAWGIVMLLVGARSARAPQLPVESRPQGPHRFTPQGSA